MNDKSGLLMPIATAFYDNGLGFRVTLVSHLQPKSVNWPQQASTS